MVFSITGRICATGLASDTRGTDVAASDRSQDLKERIFLARHRANYLAMQLKPQQHT